MELFFFIFFVPTILVTLDFMLFIFTGKRLYPIIFQRLIEVASILFLPLFYFNVMDSYGNDCCSDSATFSPDHRLTIYTIFLFCIIVFFISAYKKEIISPIVETIINSTILGAIIFNVVIAIQINSFIWMIGNLPIIILFIFELIKNHERITEYGKKIDFNSLNKVQKLAWNLLNSRLIVKIPLLLILVLPILSLISSLLLLFGQKPDSIIRAFTDTYKHGFSQLDYMCDNVMCGGHFLCSVAAKGHKNIVHPTRLGERGRRSIMCNRQLLISNAFEELLEELIPKTHRKIRTNYNKVGNMIHKHYGIFNIKLVSDIVYLLMKPLEWMFILTLYTFDKNPENRIAKQYLRPEDRKKIDQLLLVS